MRSPVRRGMAPPEAKRAIEALLSKREVTVDPPKVADPKLLIAELAESGIDAASMVAETPKPTRVPARLG